MDEIEENIEGPGEHEGEEQAEAGEVDISLRAMARVNNSSRCETTEQNVLELAGSEVSLRTDVRRALLRFREVGLRSYPPHPLHRVHKQDRYKSAQFHP